MQVGYNCGLIVSMLLAVFWQKIFYIPSGYYQNIIFKLGTYWSKLSWRAMYHSHDVIKPLSEYITSSCVIFIADSNGAKVITNDMVKLTSAERCANITN